MSIKERASSGEGSKELFPSVRTLEGSSACFRFIDRLKEVKHQPTDDLEYFTKGREALGAHLQDPESWGYKVRVVELLHRLSELCREDRPTFVRYFVVDFFAQNLDFIEGLVDKNYYLPGEDSTIPDISGSAVCLEAASCLINSGNPDWRRRSYEFLYRNKNEFLKSLGHYGDMMAFDRVLDNLVADPVPFQTEEEREFTVVADFVRGFLSIKGKGLFTSSWSSYPRKIIQEWVSKYFNGEAKAEQLFEISSLCAFFSRITHGFSVIFGERGTSYAGKEAKSFAKYWLDGRLSFKVSDEDIDKVVLNITRLERALRHLEFKTNDKSRFFSFKRAFIDFLVSRGPLVLLDCEPVIKLVENKMLPTPYLAGLVAEQGDEGIREIKRLATQKRRGNFDPSNPVQRDLEWLNYFILTYKPHNRFLKTYSEFCSLSEMGIRGVREARLTSFEEKQVGRAAIEAALLYWFIYKRAQGNSRILVLANKRYGDDFVVNPLIPLLKNLNIEVRDCYVHSGPEGTPQQEFDRIERYLSAIDPDEVIVVDGTSRMSELRGKAFPRSFVQITDWLSRCKNGLADRYRIFHWTPEPREEIDFADKGSISYVGPTEGGGAFIFANPVLSFYSSVLPADLRSTIPGFFDDFDSEKTNRSGLVFDSRGSLKRKEVETRVETENFGSIVVIKTVPVIEDVTMSADEKLRVVRECIRDNLLDEIDRVLDIVRQNKALIGIS